MAKERANSATVRGVLSGRAGARVLATLCVAASAAIVLPASTASAEPKQSRREAEAKLKKLNERAEKLENEFNKAKEDWKAAKAKLDALNKSVQHGQTTYESMRRRMVQMASTAYKNGDSTSGSVPALVSAGDPRKVLDQMSIFTTLSRNRATEVNQFLNAAQVLQRQQAQAKQATDDLARKKKELDQKESEAKSQASKQQKLVNQLGGSSSSSSSSRTGGSYTGPASGSARKALDYAYAQLGKPYVYGGTGPNGYDCSGLTMMSWRAAGVSLPRIVPDQHRATKAVSRANLQPGDLVFFNGDNHMGMYVGGGKFIHAPHTGDHVRIASLDNSYYRSVWNGGGRP